MKNKISLLIIIFIASLFVANSSYAGSRRNESPCAGSYWSEDCQRFNRERDYIDNLKQIPVRRNESPCAGSYWSDDCQRFNRERDYIDNLKQIPINRRYYKDFENKADYYNDLRFDYPNLNFDYDF